MSSNVEEERIGQNRGEWKTVSFKIAAILVVVILSLQVAIAAETSSANPPKPDKVVQGRKLFARLCTECHADDASGDEGPDLRGLDLSDQKIRKTIMQGRKGEMPAFKKLDEDAISSLIAYFRTLEA